MRLFVIVVLVSASGCYRTTAPGDGSDAGPPPDPVGAFARARSEELCRRSIECEPEFPLRWGWVSQIDCHPSYIEDSSDGARARVERGGWRFDADVGARCLDTLRAHRGCLTEDERELCFRAPFAPTLAEGDACNWLSDACGSGLYCDHRTCACEAVAPRHAYCGDGTGCDDEATCWYGTSTCELRPGLGAPCEHDTDCRDEDLFCVDGECAPLPPVADGDPCPALFECGPGFYCNFEGAEQICRRRRDRGEPCRWVECEEQLRCLDTICTTPRREGETCGLHDECDSSAPYCVGGLCRADAEGARCSDLAPLPVFAECPAGLRCGAITPLEGICVRVVAPGATCRFPEECPLGHRCAEGVCRLVVMPDEPCGRDARCPRTHVCEGDACVPLPTLGQPCSAERPCLQGGCIDGTCALRAPGDRCETHAECWGGCEDGACVHHDGEGDRCDLPESGRCGAGLACAYHLDEAACVQRCPAP